MELGQTALILKAVRKPENENNVVNYTKPKQCQYSYLQAEAALQYSSWNTTKTHSLFTVRSGNTDEKQDSAFVNLSSDCKFFKLVYLQWLQREKSFLCWALLQRQASPRTNNLQTTQLFYSLLSERWSQHHRNVMCASLVPSVMWTWKQKYITSKRKNIQNLMLPDSHPHQWSLRSILNTDWRDTSKQVTCLLLQWLPKMAYTRNP